MLLRQIRITRKQNKLSQQQVADALGISRSTYCSYETGRRTPGVDVLLQLCEFYNLPYNIFVKKIEAEFLNDEDYYDGQPDTRYLSQLSKEERDLIVKLRRLNNDERKSVENFINEKVSKF